MNANEPTDLKEVVFALNTCIEACTDGEKGYALAAADVRSPTLKELFLARSLERADFVTALQKAARDLDAVPENQGSPGGTLHRGWVGLRKILEGPNDQLILEEIVRGEEAARIAYQEALCHATSGKLSPTIASLLKAQNDAIAEAISDLRKQHAQESAAISPAKAKVH